MTGHWHVQCVDNENTEPEHGIFAAGDNREALTRSDHFEEELPWDSLPIWMAFAMHYGLCFVRAPWAYFTRLPLDQQWGDGWERAPYEQHAGPYPTVGAADPDRRLRRAAVFADLGYDGKERSANEINRGDAPWLRTQDFVGNAPVQIMAGVTLDIRGAGRTGRRPRVCAARLGRIAARTE